MRTSIAKITVIITLLAAPALAQQSLDALVDRELPQLVNTYKMLHAAPELSHYEIKTSAFLAQQLRALGYEVTENVGKYDRPEWKGHGVIAVMKNGAGPTVLVRSDMDALPVEEKTDLPYASTVKIKNDAGQEVSVMHACGHDIHITSLIGTATMLARLKDQWHGTLILIGQPAEETIDGAKAMLADGLYSKIPKPNYIIALHDSADLEAGKISYTPGWAMANSTSVEITIRGLGGHGSKPEATKDPIVVAAQVILALQTIVSRENSPLDPAVVTIGSIHGGAKSNIIPDEVKLLLTVRSYKEEVRQHILASISRITKNIAAAAGIPEDRAPIVRVSDTEVTPALYNDPDLTERVARTLEKTLGADNVVKAPPIMASEDFGRYGLSQQVPSVMFWLGAVEPAKVEASRQSGKPLPSLHSSLFAPQPEPTLRTGVKAMTAAVLELMKK
ncbi:MAG TPA: amidohydrolase [Pyrinomonadaceae bacterium]|jgi:hippurate hydrolase|nr:amidohydrolase [Pyrinomonadaceae bacterium]